MRQGKGLRDFQKLKDKVGEKNVLREWNETYYAQHQLYMLYRGRTRGYMVVASAGGRDWASCRTEFNREAAEFYVERARQIIFERDRLPDRISENVHFWKCRWCEFSAVCHEGAAPARNCRTCVWGCQSMTASGTAAFTMRSWTSTFSVSAASNSATGPPLWRARLSRSMTRRTRFLIATAMTSGLTMARRRRELGQPRRLATTPGAGLVSAKAGRTRGRVSPNDL